MLLKFNFAKTYDMLDWNFILEVMRARKSGDKWIAWIDKCLQYADDTLLFCKSEEGYISNLKVLLYGFELASGLKINFDESFVLVLENNDELQVKLAQIHSCVSGSYSY